MGLSGYPVQIAFRNATKGVSFALFFSSVATLFFVIAAAVIVLWLGGIVSVVCLIVLSKGCKPFMEDLTRADTSRLCLL